MRWQEVFTGADASLLNDEAGGSWTAANVFTGTAFRPTGPAWLGVPYDVSRHSVQPVGSVTFTFSDIGTAT